MNWMKPCSSNGIHQYFSEKIIRFVVRRFIAVSGERHGTCNELHYYKLSLVKLHNHYLNLLCPSILAIVLTVSALFADKSNGSLPVYAAMPLGGRGGLRELFLRFYDYFKYPSQNTMLHLAIFIGVIMAYFMVRLSLNYHAIKKSRRSIPLIIGGWGTRGKSGTERMKAALFQALGYETLVKTTGNEAMFVHSVPGQKPLELFIFRPYDKATIWEQKMIVKLAAALKVRVMTWECMALNPRYVRILQRSWMKDDMATITNTYPDHEDIQGPAGVNIPQVIGNFIPRGKVCFTATDQMLPILQAAAREQKTDLQTVGWRDIEFLTDDVLERFPYKEHPANISLVLKMAEQLGIERDFVLKEVADNVMADIGALKTYPDAVHLGRKLEFTLGNSANERLGFMNNWVRAGFDKHSAEDAGVWITTCVNNRADRIPRSKVFANILVMDISAHKHFLIGTNLAGLYGYIHEALSRRLENLFLVDPDNLQDIPDGQFSVHLEKRFEEILDEFKVEAATVDDVIEKLRIMLKGLGSSPEIIKSVIDDANLRQNIENTNINSRSIEVIQKIVKTEESATELLSNIEKKLVSDGLAEEIAQSVIEFLETYIRTYRSVSNFRDYIKTEAGSFDLSKPMSQALNDKIRELARGIFNDKLEIIVDSAATGDQIIDRIAKCSPPGFNVRIMGMQNIKGTGLDFAYRWVSLGKVVEMLPALKAKDEKSRNDAIRWFRYYKEYGILDCIPAIEAMENARKLNVNSTAITQQQLEDAIDHVKSEYEEKREQLSEVRKQDILSHISGVFEQILDTWDSRKRKKKADAIIKDLIKERISHEQAAIVLRDITKRQKGGWLEHDVRNRLSKLSFKERRKKRDEAQDLFHPSGN